MPEPIKVGSPEWMQLPWLECAPIDVGGYMGTVRITVDGNIPLEIRGAGNSPFEAMEAAIATTRQAINQLAFNKAEAALAQQAKNN